LMDYNVGYATHESPRIYTILLRDTLHRKHGLMVGMIYYAILSVVH